MENKIILQVGVKALLKNDGGEYLILWRSSVKYPEVKGRWDIVGGRINPGQGLIENLRREIKEETGLELVGEPALITAQDILRDPSRHVVRLTYTGEVKGAVCLDNRENDEYKWCKIEELKNMEDLDIYLKEVLKYVKN